jgi:DNA-binding NtrC family response regulator
MQIGILDMSEIGSMSEDFISINIIGQSPAFLDVISTVRQVASHDVVVSIYGETGTGKELVARSLHYSGARATGPFIPVNCGTLSDNLFESELFGHEKGAFTDARQEHQGLVEQANGGTLFLDEIETLSLKGQIALLRFLQDKQFRRVGGKRIHTADVRVVVASNVHLNKLRDMPNRFREDLFYRLNVLPIRMPPLRERPEDIPLLARHFLSIFKVRFNIPTKHFSRTTMEWFLSKDWPGNVRELENTIQRGVLLAPADEICPEHLQPPSLNYDTPVDKALPGIYFLDYKKAKEQAVNAFERDYLSNLMSRTSGNISTAAKHANTERSSLSRLLKKYQINPLHYRSI